MSTEKRLVLHLEWSLPASPASTYRALTDPEQLAGWWGPWGFTTGEEDWRPGKPGRQILPTAAALGEVVVGEPAGLVLTEGDGAEAIGRFACQDVADG